VTHYDLQGGPGYLKGYVDLVDLVVGRAGAEVGRALRMDVLMGDIRGVIT
jgi:hypothetical protein